MKMSRVIHACLAITTLLCAGCESNGISNRITEKSAVFASLTAEQQQLITDGFIAPGYTPDMTYLVLGKPTSIGTKQNADASLEMWTYKKYYPSAKCAEILTTYSTTRNPNLHRSLNLETGKATVNANAPGNTTSLGATATGSGNDLSLPDLPVYNLYIFFQADRVVEVKLESLDGTAMDGTLLDGTVTLY